MAFENASFSGEILASRSCEEERMKLAFPIVSKASPTFTVESTRRKRVSSCLSSNQLHRRWIRDESDESCVTVWYRILTRAFHQCLFLFFASRMELMEKPITNCPAVCGTKLLSNYFRELVKLFDISRFMCRDCSWYACPRASRKRNTQTAPAEMESRSWKLLSHICFSVLGCPA